MNVQKMIQESIDEAWSTNVQEEKDFQNLLFPNGKPTIKEFLTVMSTFGTPAFEERMQKNRKTAKKE